MSQKVIYPVPDETSRSVPADDDFSSLLTINHKRGEKHTTVEIYKNGQRLSIHVSNRLLEDLITPFPWE